MSGTEGQKGRKISGVAIETRGDDNAKGILINVFQSMRLVVPL